VRIVVHSLVTRCKRNTSNYIELARVLLRASLGAPERRSEHPPVSLEHLFDRLAGLREGLPPVDAAAITAAGSPDRHGVVLDASLLVAVVSG
jgi:hypothetical protein